MKQFDSSSIINSTHIDPETARAEMQYLYEKGQESVQKAYEAGKPEIFEANGEKYFFSDGSFERILPVKPDKIVKPDTFTAFSLDGLIDFIKTDVDGFFKDEKKKCIVRVIGPTQVEVVTPTEGYWMERITLANCRATVPEIHFGSWMDPEMFQITVMSNFLPSANRENVLKLAASIRKEQNMEVADDGVSQRVSVNEGVATVSSCTVQNPVYLTPIRTFQEVEQPEGPFVLRVNRDGNVALFTGDGGAWKLDAVARVTEYLRNNLEGYNVVVIG